MSETAGEYKAQPLPEPVYRTVQEIWVAAGEAYRTWRSYGWSEGEAARAASEFYGYQVGELHKRERTAEPIETVCAWCDAHLGGPVGASQVSHGICPECLEEKFPEMVTEAVNLTKVFRYA